MATTSTTAEQSPLWVDAWPGFNIVSWQNRFYAVPEDAGPAYLDPAEFHHAAGTLAAATLVELREALGFAPVAQDPGLDSIIDHLLSSADPSSASGVRFLISRLAEREDENSDLERAIRNSTSLPDFVARLGTLQLDAMRRRLNSDRKTVAIYFPSAAYREHAGDLSIRLRELGLNCLILIGTVTGDRHETGANVFYGGHDLVQQMDFVDLFIVPTLMLGLPERSRKLLLVHDIYDSPVGDLTEFRRLLAAFDFCVLPSPFVVEMFNAIVSTPDAAVTRSRPLHLIPGGYVKLDRLIAHFEHSAREEKVIIYAPTVTGLDFEDVISLPAFGAHIIECVLTHFPDYEFIFRPHPHSLKTPLVQDLAGRFRHRPGFHFDDNAGSYLDNYARSALMISDISGTAYTYAFATLRPIVFFSPNEPAVQERFAGLHYVRDRAKVGSVVENIACLPAAIRKNLDERDTIRTRIRAFRDQIIFNVGSSEEKLCSAIATLLEGKTDAEWRRV